MNKWEEAYAIEVLEPMKRVGEISWYGFESIKLRLATLTWYTPDFAVFNADRLEFHEVKGFWRDDAVVKFKVVAELMPWAKFTALRKRKVSEGGGWEVIRELNA